MTPTPADDADRLRLRFHVLRAQAGDERAFAELYAEHAPRTLAYARALVGADADDVQQETWLAVFRHLRSLQEPAAFRLWLLRATRHQALNWLRRHRRERELRDETPLEELPPAETAAPGDLQALLDSRLADGALDAALAGLPPPQREAIRLHYHDGLSVAQVALLTGVAPGTVKSRLHHARRTLQHILSPE